MNLPEQAINELKDILRIDIGNGVEELTETELNEFGDFVLTVVANSLKVRSRKDN